MRNTWCSGDLTNLFFNIRRICFSIFETSNHCVTLTVSICCTKHFFFFLSQTRQNSLSMLFIILLFLVLIEILRPRFTNFLVNFFQIPELKQREFPLAQSHTQGSWWIFLYCSRTCERDNPRK